MINIICVGKLKDKYLVDMSNDYLTRLTKYHKVNIIDPLICSCGGDLSKDKNLFCPVCKSTRMSYGMSYIT